MIRFALTAITAIWAVSAQAEVNIKPITSPGGINAWLLEEPSIPFTAMEIMFKGGAALDPMDQGGAANLMMALIEEGSGDLNAQEFAAAQEALAASFAFNVYDDTVSISVKFLTENREEALALLKTAIMEPRFDQDAIDRVRAQVISNIKSDEKDPDSIASAAWDEMAFGDHPYARDLSGTLASVEALDRDDLLAAHERLFVRDTLFVSAVGDITADDLGSVIDTLLGGLPEGTGLKTAPVEFATTGGLTVIDVPTPQSVALFGHGGD